MILSLFAILQGKVVTFWR